MMLRNAVKHIRNWSNRKFWTKNREFYFLQNSAVTGKVDIVIRLFLEKFKNLCTKSVALITNLWSELR